MPYRKPRRCTQQYQQLLTKPFEAYCKYQQESRCEKSQSKFLEFTFKAGRIQLHPKTLDTFKQQVRELTNRNWGVSMHYLLFKISQYLRGWINYFGIANCYQLCVDLDHWIRRRVRMDYWRQWRKPRTKVRNLMKRSSGCRLWHYQQRAMAQL